MPGRRRIWLLFLLMAVVAVGVAAVSLTTLYRTSLRLEQACLGDMARSQARFLEAVARFDVEQAGDYPGGPFQATLGRFREGSRELAGMGESGELLLAQRDGEWMRVLLRHPVEATEAPDSLPVKGELGEPQRRALSGQSGVMVARDYMGELVLAAYEPVGVYDLGIVAKIDLREVRAPFVRAGLLAGGVGMLLVLLGSALLLRFSDPWLQGLRDSEALVQAAPVAIVQLDPDGRVGKWNPAAQRIFGWREEEVVGEMLPLVPPEKEVEFAELRRRVLGGESLSGVELARLKKGGTPVDVRLSTAPLRDRRGAVTGIMAVLEDITEEKRSARAREESEAFIRAVMDVLPIGVAVNSVDPSVEFLYMNDVFPRIYRTTREALSDPDAFWEAAYQDPELREEIRGRVLADLASGEPRRMSWEEVPITREGEETTYITARNTPVPARGLMISTVWDVTERRLAQEAFSASEERYRRLAENAVDLIYRYRFRPDPGFEYVNPAATAMTGYTPEEHYADPQLGIKLVHPEDRHLMEGFFAPGQAEDLAKPLLLRWIRKNGESLWTEQRNVLMYDEDGVLVAVEGIARDVTELAQREIEDREASLAKAQRIARLGSWTLDLETGGEVWSREMFRLTGFSREEGPPSHAEFLGWVHPEDRDRLRTLEEDMGRTGSSLDAEIRRDPGLGVPRWFQVSEETEEASEGRAARLVGTLQDITARKEIELALRTSEARYRELFHANPLPIWIYDLESLAVLDVNDSAIRHYGYSRREFLSMTLRDIRPPEDVPRSLEEVAGAIDPLDDGGVWRHLRKDGSVISVEIRSHSVEFEGRPARLVLANDVTDRLAAEEGMRRLAAELEGRIRERTAQLSRANKELEAFTYIVSHDLKAPLRAIDGFSRILEKDYGQALDDEGLRVLGVVRANSAHMAELIDDLLTFSRLGRTKLRTSPVHLGALVESALEDLRPEMDERPLDLVVEALPTVLGDRLLLRQVLVNLLSNALKFTLPRELARIRVGCRMERSGVVVSVEDNGVGFDPDYGHKLFEVFQRLHHADEFPGTGVGLAIVRLIVERHGGRVWAEGTPGEGASFYFALPGEGGEGAFNHSPANLES